MCPLNFHPYLKMLRIEKRGGFKYTRGLHVSMYFANLRVEMTFAS